MKNTQDAILNKIKKLLALAGNNPSEAEAQSAYAKAQALMAEYSVELSEEAGEDIEIVTMACTHSNNEGYRKPLAVVIADNFRVKCFMLDNTVMFFGVKADVEIAVEVFNHAYSFSHRKGLRLEREARKNGYSTHGVANSYWHGFIVGLRDILQEQCKALMIVTPEAVQTAWDEKVKGMTKARGGMKFKGYDGNAYQQGVQDGKEHMRKTKSLE